MLMNKKKFVKIIVSSTCIVLLSCVVYSAYLFSKIKRVAIDRRYVTDTNNEVYTDENFINICLIGSDQYSDADYSADSIMILTIDKTNKKLKLTSLMRDMYLNNPETGEKFNLNEAMILGGHELLLKTINSNFNLSIDKFVEANLNSFPKIVDSIGGVNIEIKPEEITQINEFIYSIDEHNDTISPLIFNPGKQLLNGTQTSAYCRLRSVSGSDTVRTQRQRYVISAIFSELKEVNLIKLISITNDLLPLVQTNLKNKEIIDIGFSLISLRINSIEEIKFPLEGDYEMLLTDGDKFHLSIDLENTIKELNKFIYSID